MLSSANIDFGGILIDLILIVFFGFGTLYTLSAGIVHRVKKQTRTVGYWLPPDCWPLYGRCHYRKVTAIE